MKTQFTKAISFLGILFLCILSFQVSAQNDTAGDNRVYIIVPQMHTFQGDLDNYMGNHLQYPKSAIDRGIQGTVNVTFVITKTGDIANISILSGISPDLDSEAVRVVSNMPPWNPGMKNGKAVNVKYNLPVYFQLSDWKNQAPSNQRQQSQYGPKPQDDTTFILRDGLYIDPYMGYGIGGPASSTGTSTMPAISMGSNLKFGVGVTYMFPSNIGISIGLQMQQYNFNYTYSNITGSEAYNGTQTAFRTVGSDTTVVAGYDESIKYSFMYAQVPLLCRYISSQENKLGFYAEAGLVINYLVNSQISGRVTETQYILDQAANTNWYDYYVTAPNESPTLSLTPQNPAKLIIAAHAAAGVLIPLTDKISLVLAVSPDFALMNAGDGSKDVVDFGTSKFYLYGEGSYGSFNSYTFDAKLLIKMSGSSQAVRVN